jgi:hypothetical protein
VSPNTSRTTLPYSVRDKRRARLADAVCRLPGPTLPPPPAALPPLLAAPPLAGAVLVVGASSLLHAASIIARATKRGALHLSPFSATIPRFYSMLAVRGTVTGPRYRNDEVRGAR